MNCPHCGTYCIGRSAFCLPPIKNEEIKESIWSVEIPKGTKILKLILPVNTQISAIQEVNQNESYVLLNINDIQNYEETDK